MSLGVQRLQRLCQLAYSAGPLHLSRHRNVPAVVFQHSRPKSSIILEQSTVLFQDGLEIQELPWVIRRLDPREFPFVQSATYAGDGPLTGPGQEDGFVRHLHECTSAQQVFKLLEVPGERVTASSAAFALQRICQLRSVSGTDDTNSFVRQAVMHELCETVSLGITHLPNSAVVSLAGCAALASSNYEEPFINLLNDEVEKRVGDAAFTISDLCSLVRVLSLGARGDVGVTTNVWIHLGSRYKEIDATNIADVYRIMRYITPEARYLWRVVERQLQLCWWQLTGDDMATIAARVAVAGRQSTATLAALGRWLHANVAAVTDAQLRSLLAAYADFDVTAGDVSVVGALERYVVARVNSMDRTAIAMAVDFFRRRRWLSTRVLDAVASDFEINGHQYAPHELLYTLRAYGQLNYVPPNASEFFANIESILSSRFAEFDPATILELLASFVYIERFPVNFTGHIFTPHFLAQVKAIRDSTVRQRAGRHLLQLETALMLEFPHKKLAHAVDRDSLKLSLSWLEGRTYKFHQEAGRIIRQLVNPDSVTDLYVPRGASHVVDFEIRTDENKCPTSNSTSKEKMSIKRIALLLLMPEHNCANTQHLLGEYATKQRHLRKLGLTVIWVDYETFMWRCRNASSKFNYIRSLLSPHCIVNENVKHRSVDSTTTNIASAPPSAVSPSDSTPNSSNSK